MYMSFLEYTDGRIEGIQIFWNKQEAYEAFPFGVDRDGYDAEGYSNYGSGPFRSRLIKIDSDITETLETCVKLALARKKMQYLNYNLDDHDNDWDESEYIMEE